mmetsp:Transcript_12259/g.18291  ORF Transcript_12259/g.18291 Transcript_12259/m.18291 type:complete len:349 (+) Transcript_12259:102-1148(+)
MDRKLSRVASPDSKYRYTRKIDLGLYGVLGLRTTNANEAEIVNAFEKLRIWEEKKVVKNYNEKVGLDQKKRRHEEIKLKLKTEKTSDSSFSKYCLELSRLEDEIKQYKEEQENVRVEARDKWRQIKEAKNILGHPLKRKIYDLEYFPEKEQKFREKREDLHQMLQRQANARCKMMRKSVAKIIKQQQKDGLIILEARYGDIYRTMNQRLGGYIDVRLPLQRMVGATVHGVVDFESPQHGLPYYLIDGFYNPLWEDEKEQEEEKWLEVIYKYNGRLHYAEFCDGDEIVLPQEDHQCLEWETVGDMGWRALESKQRRFQSLVRGVGIVTVGILSVAGFAHLAGLRRSKLF